MKKFYTFSVLFFFVAVMSITAQTFTFSKNFVVYGSDVSATTQRISGGFDGNFSEEISLVGNSQSNGQGRHILDVEYRLASSTSFQSGDSLSFYMKLGTFIPILPGGTLNVCLLDEAEHQVGNLIIDLSPLSSVAWTRYAIKIPTGVASLKGVSFIITSSQTISSFYANVQLDFDKVELWRTGVAQLLTSFEEDITAVEDTKSLPTTFQLEQNYPNPFNPSTSISFSVPVSGRYSLKVFNLLGEEVATLIEQDLSAGIHKVNFNANNLATGIYLYSLRGNNVSLTKKMILMK